MKHQITFLIRRLKVQNKFFIISALFLAGCATNEPVIRTVIQRVEVPIAVPCKATIPPAPELNFNNLTELQSIFDKTKSVLADRHLHIAYEGELLAALKSCID